MPDSHTADAGYGSEENYQWMENNQVAAYVKHHQFDRQQRKTITCKKPLATDNLHYNKEQDYYVCPMGQHMELIATSTRTTTTGYQQTSKKYEARNCEGCPLRGVCYKAKGNRVIEVNENLLRLKKQADDLLKSEEGIKKRKQRCCDVEPVFGNIKYNHHFKRFMLRGIDKVTVETGLIALAHNLRKKAA